ncbi:MarR family winged helix-turn-helix transcriptional regulator [Serinicoccus sediminis]|uniref:MarR family winged helix-turn-helix transcriptional regulator n=1 Tax=Serinicoccus sediminis TaxID=2306021 RepID=UPI00102265CD|nr:MarR family winged helix-turn-helix transcriptional regulator [Serinicoccus sediminis]
MTGWEAPLEGGSLAAALLRAADWFNDALLTRLHDAGWPALSRGHAQVFVNLGEDGSTPAELARRMGMTRQSAHALVRDLAGLGLVELVGHPTDGRSRLVRLTDQGEELVGVAVATLAEIEQVLAGRIGTDGVAGLRTALAREWGDPPSGP